MNKGMIGFLAGWMAMAAQAELSVLNFSVQQVPGTKRVEIGYDVTSSEGITVDVSLTVRDGAQTVTTTSLSGDVGLDVAVGTGKQIVWNGGADWNGQTADLTYTLTVDNGVQRQDASIPAPLAKTGQTASYRSGDDGALEKGVTWPSPRFTDLGDTVLNNLTGLEWVEDPHSLPDNPWGQTWNNAIDFCNVLSFSGNSDWRLPNRKELLSLIDYGNGDAFSLALPTGHPFLGIKNNFPYWLGAVNSSYMRTIDMRFGNVSSTYASQLCYVWPVRTGQTGAPAPLPASGQTTVYRPGDDGTHQAGVAWPIPRFTDFGNTVLDNLTGLEWIKSPDGFSTMSWSSAIDYCNGLSYDGHSNWRLPNVKELESLVHCGEWTSSWLNSAETPFSGIESNYWASTSAEYNTGNAWYVNMSGGIVYWDNKAYGFDNMVWPVRNRVAESTSPWTIVLADFRDYTLTVTADHGSPVPAVGTYTLAWGTNLTFSAGTEVDYTCTGWSGAGCIPVSGTNSVTGEITFMDTPVSSITWNWKPDWEGFALWAQEHGLTGDEATLFIEDHDGDGIPNGLEYVFGDNLQSNDVLLEIKLVDGEPVVEIPLLDAATVPFVDTELLGSVDLENWTLPVALTNGAPAGREWFYSLTPVPGAFFRLEAVLK